MTTQERTTVQNFINKMDKLEAQKTEIFNWFKDESGKCSGYRWCSLDACYDEIQTLSDQATRREADRKRDDYIKLDAQRDLIISFGSELAELGFWKKGR